MPMKTPPHPGRVLRQEIIEPLGLSITDAAEVLRVSRLSLSKIVNSRGGISPEMAIRISKAFSGPSASVWLKMQAAYDLAQAELTADEIDVDRFEPA